MYKAHYINPLKQHGRISFDLIIEDDEGVLPSMRLQKSYIDSITESGLTLAANAEIARVLLEQELPEQQNVLPLIDLPEGVDL